MYICFKITYDFNLLCEIFVLKIHGGSERIFVLLLEICLQELAFVLTAISVEKEQVPVGFPSMIIKKKN